MALYICWGSTYLAIRFAVETLPPFLMSGLRFLTAGTMMFLYSLATNAERPNLSQWKSTAAIGAFLLLGGNGLVVWSQQFVPSGIVALVIGVTPLWIVLIAWMWGDGGRPNLRTSLGLTVGFIGLFILIGPRASASADAGYHPAGIVAVILATLSWAVGSIYTRKRADLPKAFAMNAGMQMLCGGTMLVLAGLVFGEPGRVNAAAVSMKSTLSFVYLVIFGSVIGFSCYAYVLQVTTPAVASTYAFVNPVVAVILGWALAAEPLSLRTVVAMVLIIAAVAGISLGRK